MATKKSRKKVTGDPTERLYRKMFSRIASKNRAEQEKVEIENARIDRLNNLPLGDPEHAERLMLTFDPILAWLDEVEKTGERPCSADGTSILRTPNHSRGDDWCQLDTSLIAVAECFELMANDLGIENEGKGLRQIGAKVAVDMMLFESDLIAARKSIAWMVEVVKKMTPIQAQEYTKTIEIRDRLSKLKPELLAA